MFHHLKYSFSDDIYNLSQSYDRQEISDKTQSFVTKGYFLNVAQNFSNVRNISDQNIL